MCCGGSCAMSWLAQLCHVLTDPVVPCPDWPSCAITSMTQFRHDLTDPVVPWPHSPGGAMTSLTRWCHDLAHPVVPWPHSPGGAMTSLPSCAMTIGPSAVTQWTWCPDRFRYETTRGFLISVSICCLFSPPPPIIIITRMNKSLFWVFAQCFINFNKVWLIITWLIPFVSVQACIRRWAPSGGKHLH